MVILTDDQGYGDLSRTGNTNLATPHIDALAEEGAVLNNFFVQPLCAPTRSEFLTGRYYSRTGVRGVTRRAERINLDEKTIGDLFLENGYKTGCFGKWHSGLQYPYHPNGRGFEEFIGYCCGHWSHYFDSTIEHNGKEYQSEGYLTDALTDGAIDFIRQNKDHPFFCYIPLNTPHSPFQVPDKYFNRFTNEDVKLRADEPEREDLLRTRSVLAMCENIDWNVGRLLQTLDDLKLMEDTIIVYFSDNGPNTVRWNGGMQGIKGDVEEGGVKSPCSITWKNHIPKGLSIDEIAGAIDLLPTLTSLTATPLTTHKPLDGLDITPLLFGEKGLYPDRLIFAKKVTSTHEQSIISVRSNIFRAGGRLKGLYDMTKDIGQHQDISQEYPDTFATLTRAINDFDNSLPKEVCDPSIPIGYEVFPYTDLPAQDADLKGKLTWSSIHPNASYIVHWCDIKDTLSWAIDVQQAGRYLVELKYTCEKSSIGTALQLTFGDHTLQGRLLESYESDIKDQEDRVMREESYDKAFYTMVLGSIYLPHAKGLLTLQATSMTGNHVCDLRGIRLVLQTKNSIL